MLDHKSLLNLVNDKLFPALKRERTRLDDIDKWYRWDHEKPHAPATATNEYKQLSKRAQAPWLWLVVTAVAQELYVDGYRAPKDPDNAGPWEWWQANGLDKRQIGIHRAALAYGQAYVSVLPGKDWLGADIPVIRGISPRRMVAFYNEPEYDDWPAFALQADPSSVNGSAGWNLKVYDDEAIYYLTAEGEGRDVRYIEWRTHDAGVCPIVRYVNTIDLEGRCDGEVEPFIPMAGRIDQTVFDRLVVQRFAAWVVRTISGMAEPDDAAEAALARLKLKVSDFLVAESPDTKFGSLPATPLDGFIRAAEADISQLAAVSQTPAHEMLGQMANLSAEALAAARASLTAKVDERKTTLGESHEQTLRLGAHIMGDTAAARDMSAEVRWRDTETRSLAQAADALGKLATMLGVPVEMLWERIPGWTDQDVSRAKAIVESGGSLEQLIATLRDGQTTDDGLDD